MNSTLFCRTHLCIIYKYMPSTLTIFPHYIQSIKKHSCIFIQHIYTNTNEKGIMSPLKQVRATNQKVICLVMHVLSIAIVMDIRHFQFPLFTLFTFIKRVIYKYMAAFPYLYCTISLSYTCAFRCVLSSVVCECV